MIYFLNSNIFFTKMYYFNEILNFYVFKINFFILLNNYKNLI